MNNKRRIDSLGRIQIPKELIEFAEIDINEKIAICKFEKEENAIMLKNLNDTQNCEIIAFAKIDYKGRMVIPYRIRKDIKNNIYEVYVVNKTLVLQF